MIALLIVPCLVLFAHPHLQSLRHRSRAKTVELAGHLSRVAQLEAEKGELVAELRRLRAERDTENHDLRASVTRLEGSFSRDARSSRPPSPT